MSLQLLTPGIRPALMPGVGKTTANAKDRLEVIVMI